MYKSEKIGQLAKALSALQGELEDVARTTTGYGYKYADLSSVVYNTRPLLAKHGLAISQLVEKIDGETGITTILLHESDEFISSFYGLTITQEMSPKSRDGAYKMNIFQVAGSSLTYFRRYGWCAILGLAQVDDDAALKEPISKPTFNDVTLNTMLHDGILEYMKRADIKAYVDKGFAEHNLSLDKLSLKAKSQLFTKIKESFDVTAK
jgi:hypothetical protein